MHSYQPEIGKTSMCGKLFGTRGKNARTEAPGRSQFNMIQTPEREHSGKPHEQYDLAGACSTGPHLEPFARGERPGWAGWGNQMDETYAPTWKAYSYNSSVAAE